MRFACRSKETLRAILGSLRNHRNDWAPAAVPTQMTPKALEAWAEAKVRPVVDEIADRMSQITDQIGEDDRLRRAASTALRKWRLDRPYDAIHWFETFLAAWPDSTRIRKEALQGVLPEEWKHLEPVRAFWVTRQGMDA